MSKDLNPKLKKALAALTKAHGDSGNISVGSEALSEYKFLETPFPTLNTLIRGIPTGRFTVIAGPSQVGKTALTYQILAHNQKLQPDLIGLWVDLEAAHSAEWSAKLGVDNDRLLVLGYDEEHPYVENVMDKVLTLLKSGTIGFLVIDSIGAMIPKGDVMDKKGDRSLEANNMLNLQVKLGEIFRRLNVAIAPREGVPGVPVVLIGHVYNVPTTTGATVTEVRGGNSVKHWATIRLAMRRGPKAEWPAPIMETLPDGSRKEVHPGFSSRVVLEKTKVNDREGQQVSLRFVNSAGFDVVDSVIGAAQSLGIIVKTGAWLQHGNEKYHGKKALVDKCVEDETFFQSLVDEVRNANRESGNSEAEASNP